MAEGYGPGSGRYTKVCLLVRLLRVRLLRVRLLRVRLLRVRLLRVRLLRVRLLRVRLLLILLFLPVVRGLASPLSVTVKFNRQRSYDQYYLPADVDTWKFFIY